MVVTPLNARREAVYLLAAITVIAMLMTTRFLFVRGEDEKSYLKPYQRHDITLKAQSPVIYRSLLSVVDELVYLRQQDGTWPSVDLLKAEHLPPFDNTFLPVGLKDYDWSLYAGKSWVDYFGRRTPGENPSQGSHDNTVFLLRIIDLHTKDHPHPHFGVDYDPKTRFTSQIWMFPEDRGYEPTSDLPEKGWKWIVSVSGSSGESPVISEEPERNELSDMLEELNR
jgi:hypothetical protein